MKRSNIQERLSTAYLLIGDAITLLRSLPDAKEHWTTLPEMVQVSSRLLDAEREINPVYASLHLSRLTIWTETIHGRSDKYEISNFSLPFKRKLPDRYAEIGRLMNLRNKIGQLMLVQGAPIPDDLPELKWNEKAWISNPYGLIRRASLTLPIVAPLILYLAISTVFDSDKAEINKITISDLLSGNVTLGDYLKREEIAVLKDDIENLRLETSKVDELYEQTVKAENTLSHVKSMYRESQKPADLLYKEASLHDRNGEYSEAFRKCERIIVKAPESIFAVQARKMLARLSSRMDSE